MDDDDAEYMQGSDDEVGQNAEDRRYCPNIYPRTMALTILTTTTTQTMPAAQILRICTIQLNVCASWYVLSMTLTTW